MEKTPKAVILFAEDNPADRIPFARALKKQNYFVIDVCNPQQANNVIDQYPDPQKLDVILLDIVMPENNPNGAQEVLQHLCDKDIIIPVILCTAWGYNGRAQKLKNEYPDLVKNILTKTFILEDLINAIDDVLGCPDARL